MAELSAYLIVMATSTDTFHRAVLAATVVVGLIILFWGVGDIPLLSLNEARRAVPVKEMLASHDWLLPRLNGDLYITKPPLFYWLAGAAAELQGRAGEWAVRLPSALAAMVVLVAVYRMARSLFGPWPALFSAQILLANAGFAVFARRAEIEMLLTALCHLSLLAALGYVVQARGRPWLWFSYGLLGLAVLTKGPVAWLFVVLPLLTYALLKRDARAWQALSCWEGWLLTVAVGASWYGAVAAQLGMDVWLDIVRGDILGKMQGGKSGGEPFYYYLLWLLGDFFPASLLLLVGLGKLGMTLAHSLHQRRTVFPQGWLGERLSGWRADIGIWREPGTAFLLLAFALPFLAFSAFGDKHAKYLLPAYPVLALLLGQRLGQLAEGGRSWLKIVGIVLPLGFAAYFAVGEATLYAYRYQALQPLAAYLTDQGDVPVYAYRELDMRTVYYYGRPIPILSEAQTENLLIGQNALLLAEPAYSEAVARLPGLCLLKEFEPYLKRGKKITVFGNGGGCKSSR